VRLCNEIVDGLFGGGFWSLLKALAGNELREWARSRIVPYGSIRPPEGTGLPGPASAPVRVSVTRLEAHTHKASPGIFVVSPNQDLTIGSVPFYSAAPKGVQNVTSGDIFIAVNGTLTTGSPIHTSSGSVTLQADSMVLGSNVSAMGGAALLSWERGKGGA
jgi:hypothetical protein